MTTIAQQRLESLRRLRDLELAKQAQEQARFLRTLNQSRYRVHAREKQLPPPGDWFVWMLETGRGFGKTFVGSGWLAEKALSNPNSEWAVVAPTFKAGLRVCMEGPSGLIGLDPKTGKKALHPDQIQVFNRSTGEIRLTNGSRIHLLSGEEPDAVRGLNLWGAWLDEFSSFRYQAKVWHEVLIPAMRISDDSRPQVIITSTPYGSKIMRELKARTDGSVVVTHGSIDENKDNLSPESLKEMHDRYDGTRIGRRELDGEDIDEVDGALWTVDSLDTGRLTEVPELVRVVVAIDPAVTSGEDADETGILVVGKGVDGRGYVLADRSCRDSPSGWAHRAVQAFEDFKADRIVAEKNQGGDMVELTLRSASANIPYKGVVAKHGKRLRAEPIAALYEQGRVSHVGFFPELEDQMVTWTPDSGYSPDRLDALVHGLTELNLATGGTADRFFQSITKECPKCAAILDADAPGCRSCGLNLISPTAQLAKAGFPLI